MPWTVVEVALRLAILLIEGVPPELRRATATAWFWGTWWMWKLNPDIAAHEKEILALVGQKPAESQKP